MYTTPQISVFELIKKKYYYKNTSGVINIPISHSCMDKILYHDMDNFISWKDTVMGKRKYALLQLLYFNYFINVVLYVAEL